MSDLGTFLLIIPYHKKISIVADFFLIEVEEGQRQSGRMMLIQILQQLKFFCNIYKYVITFSIIYLEQFNI